MSRRAAWLLPSLAAAVCGLGAARSASAAPTVVTLTFDDTNADAYDARPLLAQHGMRATFFVNSARIGEPGRLTLSQLQTLYADGHEIGGHTVEHLDLAALEPDEQRRQICDDRVALLGLGFAVTSFAYPYGDEDAALAQRVADCGYNAARSAGGLDCGPDCLLANLLPPDPAQRYAIRSPGGVRATTSVDEIEQQIRLAEESGGGWVPLELHHVCDGCNEYAIRREDLAALLDWLGARAAQGTLVRTMAQVVGGPLLPPVPGPPPPPPPAGPNLLRDPALEEDQNGDGVPDCWALQGEESIDSHAERVPSGHDGGLAERLVVSASPQGTREFLSRPDLGGCAPKVAGGQRYTISFWYSATDNAGLVVLVRKPSGAWISLAREPLVPSATFVQTSWTTPPLPPEATALSVGVSLSGVGVVETDDFSVTPGAAAPPGPPSGPPPANPPPPAAGGSRGMMGGCQLSGSGPQAGGALGALLWGLSAVRSRCRCRRRRGTSGRSGRRSRSGRCDWPGSAPGCSSRAPCTSRR